MLNEYVGYDCMVDNFKKKCNEQNYPRYARLIQDVCYRASAYSSSIADNSCQRSFKRIILRNNALAQQWAQLGEYDKFVASSICVLRVAYNIVAFDLNTTLTDKNKFLKQELVHQIEFYNKD